MIIEIPKYDNVRTGMCQLRRNGLGTGQNPEDISKIVFSEEVLRLSNNSGFLLSDHTDDAEEK